MLGGAVGAAASQLSAHWLINGALAFVVGGVTSVLMYAGLQGMIYVVVRWVFQAELEERTIGGHQGDSLAGAFGAIVGMIGAFGVMWVSPSGGWRAPQMITVCWSSTTLAALMLFLGLLAWTQRGERL